MTLATDVVLRASAAAAASGTGTPVDLAEARSVDLLLDVTAVSGTLTVFIDTAPSETGPWTVVTPTVDGTTSDVFEAVTTTGSQVKTFPDLSRWLRVRWTLSGGGSATFSLTGESVVVYATPSDLSLLGLNTEWVSSSSSRAIDAAMRAKTDVIDSALFTYWLPDLPEAELTDRLPLVSWGYDIREACAALAAESLVVSHGHRPDSADDRVVYERASLVREWLDLVAAGRRRPARMVARTTA